MAKKRTGRKAKPGTRVKRARRTTSRVKPRTSPRASKKLAGGVAPGMPPISCHLTVRDVAGAVEFYEKAFGFRRRNLIPGPDGKLMHAELAYRDSVVMLGPESPRGQAPTKPGATPVSMYVYVEDVDRVVARAREAGGTVADEPQDQFWGDRTAVVIDPEGHAWMLATFKKLVPIEEMKPGGA